MRIVCMMFGHKRSFKKARKDFDKEWRSACRWCGRPMIRRSPKHWELDDPKNKHFA